MGDAEDENNAIRKKMYLLDITIDVVVTLTLVKLYTSTFGET